MKTILLALLLSAGLFAADPTGSWKAAIDSPQGKMELTFIFKMENGVLKGTVASGMGDMQVTDIKVDGDKISFNASMGDFVIPHKGTFSATEMKLQSTVMDQSQEIVAKKAS